MEYVPDAATVVGGLTQKQIDEVESLALRIADGEGPVMIWFLEDYRDDTVLVV